MECVSQIITPIVQPLMDLVKKHLGILVSSTKSVKQMDAKMKQLKDTAQEVQARLDRAVGNTEVVPGGVEPWLEDVTKLNERSDNLKEAIGWFNLTKRYKTGKQSYEILEEIKELENRKFEFTGAQKPLAEVGSTSVVPSTSAPGTQIDFESRDSIFKSALQALQSNNESHNMIALCGMGGVGKTTMMEQLKKDVVDSKTFNLIVKVVIGENNHVMNLQKAIAEYIGNDLTETTKDARAGRLEELFKQKSQQGQKILVIMDDLWSEVDLKDVGLSPLPDGFKMLFTSRFETVCSRMGCHLRLRIPVLNDNEAKTLFSKNVSPSPWDGDDELKSIGDEIVTKCGGLPIAIVTIAKFLSDNIKDAWHITLRHLKEGDLKDLKSITHRIFEMSYKNLKEDDDKATFILCGLFPDDFDIHREDLLRYGWGLEFYEDSRTLVMARQHMNVCVNNLIRANLLIESDVIGCVKMHDLVRAFVLNDLTEVKQASIVSHENMSVHTLKKDANKSYERLLIKCEDMCEIPRVFNYSNLSLLILMDGNNHKFFEDIFNITEKLKVVSCENLGIPLLPVMFEHSNKLRTIRLQSCKLIDNDISFLGSLDNLEILSLVYCNIRRLPSTIGKLKKLKLLDLNECIDLHIDDGVIQNLESLEELHLRASNRCPIRFTHANCVELQEISQRLFVLELEFIEWTPQKQSVSRQDMPQLKNMSFKNLERFEISIGCELHNKWRKDYSLKNRLNLVATRNELHECNISDIFERTEELNLEVNDMYYLEDISMNHTFCQLRVFDVSNCTNLTCLFTPDMARGLKKLERLTISECPVLEAMVGKDSGAEVITFPEVVELRLCGLTNFTSIYHDNNSAMQPLLNTKVMMPKLEILDISKMENLMQIWPCEISKNDVSMLKKILVRECDNLINLFPSNPLPLLNHLEELGIKNCGSIEVLFNMELESVCGTREYDCSKLRSIGVKYLGKLKELWRMKGVNTSDVHVKCFRGVERIWIESCPVFKNIFTPTTINFDLGGLAKYVTMYVGEEGEILEMDEYGRYPSHFLHTCHHLQHLELKYDKRVKEVLNSEMDSHQPLLLLLPYLESIELTDLEEMSHVWKCNWNKFSILHHPFQNLTNIYISSCPKLKYLFSPLMAKYLSNLKSVDISSCDGIEEVISSRDDEPSYQNIEFFFPHLDTLRLSYLGCLKSIDGHDSQISAQVSGACWSLCQYPTTIHIEYCDALSSLVPWYSARQMKRLQQLDIRYCKAMKEVFESESGINYNYNYNVDEGCASALVAPQLTNLKSVYISGCDLLSHVFTFSTLESLKQLKELRVRNCKSMEVIVKEENIGSSSSKDDHHHVVVFPRLKTFLLEELPNLKGFFLGKNEFRLPVLDLVMINDCPQLMVFTSGQSETPNLKYIRTKRRILLSSFRHSRA